MFELNDVSFIAPSRHRLINGVTLKIPQGSRTAVLGLNGAGKTTLLKLMSGWLQPGAGSILLNGTPLSSYSPRARARLIAFVPQDFPSGLPFTVFEFARMGLFARHCRLFSSPGDDALTRGVLARLELDTLADRNTATLSGGEKQRLLLARALVQDTPVILLDEPLNHLDIKNRLLFLDLLGEEHARGRTLVAVLHEIAEAHRHFDDVIALTGGQLAYHGAIHGLAHAKLADIFAVDAKRLPVMVYQPGRMAEPI